MRSLLLLSVFVWLVAVGCGVFYLTRFENTAAETNIAYPAAFPTESRLDRDPKLPTLLFFAHPKCPCTRAGLHELARLMTDIDGKVKAYVVFIKPTDESDEWASTDLLAIAEAIPNVQVVIDRDERETKIFNAQTSSTTLLYDGDGNLRFNGGITASRGHEGDNAGRTSIFEIVTANDKKNAETLVFGCPLHKKDCPGELMETAK
jgi:hypothetical protein